MDATLTGRFALDIEDVLDDLEAGKSRPLFRATRSVRSPVPLPKRPRLGGPEFLLTWLSARGVGRLHPRLARRFLWRLWFTPWTGPTRDVTLPDRAHAIDRVVAGRQVGGFVVGRGPTVMAIHGWGGSSRDMVDVAADLAAMGHRVVVPDLPGHGASPGRLVNAYEMAAALAELMLAEGPVEGIVAHSLGFPTTLLAFERLAEAGLPHPRRVAAIGAARRMEAAVDRFVERGRLRPALGHQLRTMLEEAFGEDLWEQLDAARSIRELDLDGLMIHDTGDREIPHDEAIGLADVWGVELITTEGLGHRRILADVDVREAAAAHVATVATVDATAA